MKTAFADKTNNYEKHYFLPTHTGDTRIEVLTPLTSDNRSLKQRINKHLEILDKLLIKEIEAYSNGTALVIPKKGDIVKFIGDHKESKGVKYKVTKTFDEPFVDLVIAGVREHLKNRHAYNEMFSVHVRDIEIIK